MAEEHNTSSSKYTVAVSSSVIDNNNHNTNLNPPTPTTINGKRSLSTTWLDEWKAQIDALLMKHVLVLSRKICAVLLLVFLPCFYVILLYVTNSAVLNGHRPKPFEPLIQLNPAQCVVLNNQHMVDHQNPSCITIMYGPSTTVTDDIMNIFVKTTKINKIITMIMRGKLKLVLKGLVILSFLRVNESIGILKTAQMLSV